MRAEVTVLGAGPAGSALATLLARDGVDVLLVDRRDAVDCVGESMLPWGTRVLEELGMDMSGFYEKHGALFLKDGMPARFDFHESLNPRWDHAWQVRRGRFDAQLRELAREAGARFLEAEVTDVTLPGTVHTSVGDVETPLVVDALGRRMFLARKLGIRDVHPNLRNAAVARQYRNVRFPESWVPGDIVITTFPGGWGWIIPFGDDVSSVGVVTTPGLHWRGDRWKAARAACPDLDRALEGAEPLTDSHGMQDFTAYARQFSGDGWALVGDAAFFLDPVFSSGVLMCLEGASRLHKHLRSGTLDAYEDELRRAGKVMEGAVLAFYDGSFLDVAYSDPAYQRDEYRRAVVSLLAGDVFDDDNPLACSLANRFQTLAKYMRHRGAVREASAGAR